MLLRRLTADQQQRLDLVPPDVRNRARLLVVPAVAPGFVGLTLGPVVLLRRGHEHDERLLAHELVHVHQQQVLGVARFLLRYGREHLRGLLRLRRWHDAYRSISYEVDARTKAAAWAARQAAVPTTSPAQAA